MTTGIRFTAGMARPRGAMRDAINELKATISAKYPSATYAVYHPIDEPKSVELEAVVDLDDTEKVLDLVLNRVMELQIIEGLPIHVNPQPTPERARRHWEEQKRLKERATAKPVPVASR